MLLVLFWCILCANAAHNIYLTKTYGRPEISTHTHTLRRPAKDLNATINRILAGRLCRIFWEFHILPVGKILQTVDFWRCFSGAAAGVTDFYLFLYFIFFQSSHIVASCSFAYPIFKPDLGGKNVDKVFA